MLFIDNISMRLFQDVYEKYFVKLYFDVIVKHMLISKFLWMISLIRLPML